MSRTSLENSSVNFRINKTNRLVVFNYSISISSTKFQVSATAANTSIKNTRVILQNSDSKQKPQGRTQNLKICNGCYLILSHSQVLVQADASKKGWGTVCKGISTGGQCLGVWTKLEKDYLGKES